MIETALNIPWFVFAFYAMLAIALYQVFKGPK